MDLGVVGSSPISHPIAFPPVSPGKRPSAAALALVPARRGRLSWSASRQPPRVGPGKHASFRSDSSAALPDRPARPARLGRELRGRRAGARRRQAERGAGDLDGPGGQGRRCGEVRPRPALRGRRPRLQDGQGQGGRLVPPGRRGRRDRRPEQPGPALRQGRGRAARPGDGRQALGAGRRARPSDRAVQPRPAPPARRGGQARRSPRARSGSTRPPRPACRPPSS